MIDSILLFIVFLQERQESYFGKIGTYQLVSPLYSILTLEYPPSIEVEENMQLLSSCSSLMEEYSLLLKSDKKEIYSAWD